MKKPKIIIITKNDEDLLEDCINSFKEQECSIIIADLGSTDSTKEIAKHYECEFNSIGFNMDFSEAKNKAILIAGNCTMLFVEPNERLLRGFVEMEDNETPKRINVIQEQVITKPIRLFGSDQKCHFINPIFEHIKTKALCAEIYLLSIRHERPEALSILEKWNRQNPLAPQPQYYLACLHLSNGRIDEFINCAEKYLFLEKSKNMSHIMTKYYLATVMIYSKKDFQKASKLILECIIEKPLMAEFWCLLGDIYYSLNKYEKAFHFYENAYIIGSRRLKNDEYPFHIEKYKKYPNEMMISCKNLIKSSKQYGISK